MYEEFLEGSNDVKVALEDPKKETFSIQLSDKLNNAEQVDIELCIKGCTSLFPYQIFSYFGVRWDETNAKIKCWCLDTFDGSMIGPQVTLFIVKGQKM